MQFRGIEARNVGRIFGADQQSEFRAAEDDGLCACGAQAAHQSECFHGRKSDLPDFHPPAQRKIQRPTPRVA
jgi:hypothetical protein